MDGFIDCILTILKKLLERKSECSKINNFEVQGKFDDTIKVFQRDREILLAQILGNICTVRLL